jgi:hypothetical protein
MRLQTDSRMSGFPGGPLFIHAPRRKDGLRRFVE